MTPDLTGPPSAPTTPELAAQIAHDNLRKQRAMVMSMATAASLTVAKLVVAGITLSVAVLSEAVHSMTDLIAAAIIWYSLRHAALPPDTRHRYGHEKLEDVSSIAEGTIIIAAIGYVMFRAISTLLGTPTVHSPLAAVAVMVVSAIANGVLVVYMRRIASETESPGVHADAQQLLVDVITSAAVAIGLTLVYITGVAAIDAIVALLVALLVLRIGLSLIVGSTRVLLDEALPDAEIELIERVLAEQFEGKVGYHRLRTRRAGSRRHVDLHLTMPSMTPLYRAHEIAHRVEGAIEAALYNVDVLTHIEPETEAPPPGADVGPGDRY